MIYIPSNCTSATVVCTFLGKETEHFDLASHDGHLAGNLQAEQVA